MLITISIRAESVHNTVPRASASLLVIAAFALAACGGGPPRQQTLDELRAAIESPVSSADESAERSRTLHRLLETEALMDMSRYEVEEAIGRGDSCSRHPQCAEQGFESDDWFYTVGAPGEGHAGALPLMILGFDRTGRVTGVWSMRTH